MFPRKAGKQPITVELGRELLPLLDRTSKKNLLRLTEAIPAQIKEEMGFRCPHVRFQPVAGRADHCFTGGGPTCSAKKASTSRSIVTRSFSLLN